MVSSEIVTYLQQAVANSSGNVDTQVLVLRFGRQFVPAPRPPGMRLRAPKKCFSNAANRVDSGIYYVEGYAMLPGQPPFHHAWLSRDGVHAIEVTLRNKIEDCAFFGILFPPPIFVRFSGYGKPLLSPPIDAGLSDCLEASCGP